MFFLYFEFGDLILREIKCLIMGLMLNFPGSVQYLTKTFQTKDMSYALDLRKSQLG